MCYQILYVSMLKIIRLMHKFKCISQVLYLMSILVLNQKVKTA